MSIEIINNKAHYGYDRGARFVVVSLIDEKGNRHRIASVTRDLEILSDELCPVKINWSAWGDCSPSDTKSFADGIEDALAIAGNLDGLE